MDDEFERRLRDVLRSRRLSVNADTDLLDRVHAGARRRQQRRLTTSASAAAAVVAVVAVVAGTVAFRPHGEKSISANQNHLLSSNTTKTSTSPAAPGQGLKPSSSISPLPSMSSSNAATAPRTFTPVSVTAVNTKVFWVLGYTTTTYSDGFAVGPTLYRTDDGAKTFTLVSHPEFILAQEPISRPSGVPLVTDVRFGDGSDGWAYGDALYQTTDAGKSWLPVKQVPGRVVDFVASDNIAWAVVDLASDPWNPSPSSRSNPKYAIYSTPYGKSAQHWSRVTLPFDDLGGPQPSIVDQDGVVTLLAAGPLRNGYHGHALIAEPGGKFIDHDAPCFQDNGGYLSNSVKAIWAACPTGHSAGLFVSTDRGATWKAATGPANFPDPEQAIGAIDDQHAIVMDDATGRLLRVGVSGPGQAVDAPTDGAAGASFIGFTTDTAGFAIIANQDATSQLLRTTDGGLHWTKVKIDG